MNARLSASLLFGIAGMPVAAQPCGSPWGQHGGSNPPARAWAAGAFDSLRGRVVLFGGSANAGALLGDTWEWTASGPAGGGTWTLAATGGPSARSRAGLAYDTVRQRTVLFGGLVSGGQFSNQTWEWDGTAWLLRLPAASPPAMAGNLLEYDASRQRTVLVSTIGFTHARTWEYDGATWTLTPDSTPIASSTSHSLAYDAARARMVLAGPVYTGGYGTVGTWERDAGGWVLKAVEGPWEPTALEFDPVRARVLNVDHLAYSGSTAIWAWNGAAAEWEVVSSSGPPRVPARAPVYDAAGGQLLLVGGGTSNAPINETRLFRSDVRSGPILTEVGARGLYSPIGAPPVTLRVAATGTSPLSFRWRLNTVELSDGGPFSGTGTSQLTIIPEEATLTGAYDALVTDACGTTIRPATHVSVSCYPNCDGSTGTPMLTAQDFQCFADAFAAGCNSPTNCYANCDGSTQAPFLNANDFMCFFIKFAERCL